MELAEDMRPGTMVTVYRDALETQREGTAKLIECLEVSRGLQRWNVRFQPPFEEPILERNINVLEPDEKVGLGIARMATV